MPAVLQSGGDPARGQPAGPFPRGAPLAIGLALAALVVAVAAVRLSGTDIRVPDAAPAGVLALRFEDRVDGSVAVIDAASGRLLQAVTGEAGFLRGTLRGLARERRRLGLGAERAFELIGRADGRLTLVDPATGQRVDLESFGPANAAVFMNFIALKRRLDHPALAPAATRPDREPPWRRRP